MAVIVLILGLGVGLIAGGLLYRLFDDILIDFFTPYIYNINSAPYLGSQLVWDAVPYVMLLAGVACLLYAGMRYHEVGVVR